ncbi:MAG: PAS domain S-box protein [Nitrospinae bacterium]|nr:PAS domain S-box protein [Nitrospinota bacterium]
MRLRIQIWLAVFLTALALLGWRALTSGAGLARAAAAEMEAAAELRQALALAQTASRDMTLETRGAAAAGGAEAARRYAWRARKAADTARLWAGRLADLSRGDPAAGPLASNLRRQVDELYGAGERTLALALDGDTGAAAIERETQAFDESKRLITALRAALEERAAARMARAVKDYEKRRMIETLALIAALAISGAAASLAWRKWLIWSERMESALEDMTEGRVAAPRLDGAPPEYRAMAEKINQTAARLDTARAAAASSREAAGLFQRAMENVNLVAVQIDGRGHIVFFNEYAQRLTGYRAGEVEGKNWFDIFIPPARRAEIRHVFDLLMSGQGSLPLHYVNTVLTRAGEERVISWNNNIVRDDMGAAAGVVSIGEDITQRARAEAELSASEERLLAIASAVPAAIVVTGGDGRVSFWNAGAERLFGWAAAEAATRSFAETALPPEGRAVFARLEEQAWRRGAAEDAPPSEITGARRSGETFPMEVSLRVMNIMGQRRLLTIARDATARRRAQQELRDSEERFRRAVLDAPLPIMIHAQDGEVIALNRAWTESCGYASHEITSLDKWIRLAFDGVDTHAAEFFRRPFPGAREEREFRIRSAAGGTRVWAFTCAPLGKLPDGRRLMISLARDVTTQKKTERELALLGAAVEQAAEAIVITAANGAIEYVNPAFERISGYTREQALGENPRILKSGEHGPGFYREMWDTLLARRVWHGRIVNRRKDGGRFEEDVTISPILDLTGAITNFVALKRDVTREVSLERHLRQSQKMEAIGTLAGGIAHDFNNILFAMLGYAGLVKASLPEGGSQRAEMDEIIKAGNRAKELVRQILAFSRRSEIRFQNVTLATLVKETLKLLRASLPAAVEIRERINAPFATVWADPTQMHQVIMNLCVNAAQAMPQGGALLITLEETDIGEQRPEAIKSLAPGSYVILRVADTGTGMDSATMERVFEPFFTTKKVGEGTGMGLSVAHGIITGHDGAITVRSEPGEGSEFSVYLPLVKPGDADGSATAVGEPPGGSERILFVDDESSVVDMCGRWLSRLGYSFTGFTAPLDALEAFRARPEGFDLVITDESMPKMSGLTLTTELSRLRPGIPIIILTGYFGALTEAQARAAGAVRLLGKPIEPAGLAAVARQVLDEARPA